MHVQKQIAALFSFAFINIETKQLSPSLTNQSWVTSFQCLTDSSCSVTFDMIHIREEHVVSWEDMRL